MSFLCRHHNGTELQGTGERIASGSIAFASMTSSSADFHSTFFVSIDTRFCKHRYKKWEGS